MEEKIIKVGDDLFSAIWLDSMLLASGQSGEYTQSRTQPSTINFKILSGFQNSLDFLTQFENYVRLKNIEVYDLTQNTVTTEYMIVFKDLKYKRAKRNGTCAHCNRFNTSYSWCQTCGPPRITQGWTSGHKVIDEFIKEFQLKTSEYENQSNGFLLIDQITFKRLMVNHQHSGYMV